MLRIRIKSAAEHAHYDRARRSQPAAQRRLAAARTGSCRVPSSQTPSPTRQIAAMAELAGATGDCLAEAMYYEARGEGAGPEGDCRSGLPPHAQRHYPATICGVVYEGAGSAPPASSLSPATATCTAPKCAAAWARSALLALPDILGHRPAGRHDRWGDCRSTPSMCSPTGRTPWSGPCRSAITSSTSRCRVDAVSYVRRSRRRESAGGVAYAVKQRRPATPMLLVICLRMKRGASAFDDVDAANLRRHVPVQLVAVIGRPHAIRDG